jgi:hypothetical protein
MGSTFHCVFLPCSRGKKKGLDFLEFEHLMACTQSALDVVNLMKQQEKELEDIKSHKLTKVILLIYSSIYPCIQA